jgi:tRNA pseudouridine65 synthase
MRDIARPILGDTTDGDSHQNRFFREKFNLKRLMLHSFYLGFTHPITGEYIATYIHPDKDLCQVFEQLNWMSHINTLRKKDWGSHA